MLRIGGGEGGTENLSFQFTSVWMKKAYMFPGALPVSAPAPEHGMKGSAPERKAQGGPGWVHVCMGENDGDH